MEVSTIRSDFSKAATALQTVQRRDGWMSEPLVLLQEAEATLCRFAVVIFSSEPQ